MFPKRTGYVSAISQSLKFNSYQKKKKQQTLPVTFSVSWVFLFCFVLFLTVKQLSVSIMTVKMVFTLGERAKKALSF